MKMMGSMGIPLVWSGLRSTWLDSSGKLIPSEKSRYLERSCPRTKGAESRIITMDARPTTKCLCCISTPLSALIAAPVYRYVQ
jgi:hypothetical protein